MPTPPRASSRALPAEPVGDGNRCARRRAASSGHGGVHRRRRGRNRYGLPGRRRPRQGGMTFAAQFWLCWQWQEKKKGNLKLFLTNSVLHLYLGGGILVPDWTAATLLPIIFFPSQIKFPPLPQISEEYHLF